MGNSGSGIELHPDTRSVVHPIKFTRFNYFIDAGGVTEEALGDEQYYNYLLAQAENIPVHYKFLGLAFDRHYTPDGEVDDEESELYIPNAYIMRLYEQNPDRMLPAISVHPYRPDAVGELERWASRGARVVKWVPNAQGMDPSSELCDPFYEAMQRLNMVLLSHAGHEHAIDSQGRQHLGNPLRLRRALDAGVKVIVAHCAVSGKSIDLDDPERRKAENFNLLLRLLDTPRYEGLLFADISAMTLLNQLGDPLKLILSRSDLHPRLLYGSDYPLPAVDVLNQNGALGFMGYLEKDEVSALDEIQANNPLLYNFVLLRSLRHPETGARFSEDLFRNRLP